METLGSLREWVQGIVEDDSIADTYDLWINNAVKQVEKMYPWGALRGEHSVTVASGALTQPPLFRTINMLWKDDGTTTPTVRFYKHSARPRGEATRLIGHWYIPNGFTTTAGTAYSGTSTEGSQRITRNNPGDDWPTDADEGKQMSIAGRPERYEITDVDDTAGTIDFYPAFGGEGSTSQGFVVDPPGQRQWLLYDEADALYSGDVLLEYQKSHPVLSLDDDLVLFDASETIRLMILQQAHR